MEGKGKETRKEGDQEDDDKGESGNDISIGNKLWFIYMQLYLQEAV